MMKQMFAYYYKCQYRVHCTQSVRCVFEGITITTPNATQEMCNSAVTLNEGQHQSSFKKARGKMGLHPHSNTEFIAQKETLACFSIAVQKKAYISRHHKHLSKHLATDLIKNALMLLTQFTLKHYISNTIVF